MTAITSFGSSSGTGEDLATKQRNDTDESPVTALAGVRIRSQMGIVWVGTMCMIYKDEGRCLRHPHAGPETPSYRKISDAKSDKHALLNSGLSKHPKEWIKRHPVILRQGANENGSKVRGDYC